MREERTLSLEEAIRKMTSQAAEAFGFHDHGVVAEGRRANLVDFDPEAVADRATFEDPLQFPVGIRDVLIGGEAVVRGGETTDRRPGRVVS